MIATKKPLDFSILKKAIERQWNYMTQYNLFRTGAEGEAIWDVYLQTFPAGTDPIFRKRTDHDCGCCRSFIKNVGNVVAIVEGNLVSLWDVTVSDPNYQVVVDALAVQVKSQPIVNEFLFRDRNIGVDKNFETDDSGKILTWGHFKVELKLRNTGKDFFCVGGDIATRLGETRAHHDVLLRSLNELTLDSVDTVLELIAQNSLYRGKEHKSVVSAFRVLKKAFDKISDPARRDVFVWDQMGLAPGNVTKIRNTAVGTLLVDLSEGLDLEAAMRKFEKVMAPENYKRPTALVTKSMVDAARKAVEELGLTSALQRRHASLQDVRMNNILFVDRSAKRALKGDVFDAVSTKGRTPKDFDKVETVTIDQFIKEIVPSATSIEIMFENRHTSNLVSLVAPVDHVANPLFKWDNNFSWAYSGDVTDSLKERVKRAGGNVTGDLCCRLAWYNFDDLDFHMREPGGTEVYFCYKKSPATGGELDVDMNAGGGRTREPVENIFYSNRHKMKDGTYTLFVHQFSQRETDNVGFEVEIDMAGEVVQFAYDKPLRHDEKVEIARIKYTQAAGFELTSTLKSSTISKQTWGLNTQTFHKVCVLMLSPNHWDGQKGLGNKHYFFMLDGCVSDGVVRGMFNEFLRAELDKHRKVIEIVGSKLKTEETEDQLSGLGFSDTKRTEVLVKVKGNVTRTLKVQI